MFLRTLLVFLIFSVTARAQVVVNDLSYFVDNSAGVKGAQIISGEFDSQFKKLSNTGLGSTKAAIWVKYTLVNPSPEQCSHWLLSVGDRFDYVTYYEKEAGQWRIHQSRRLFVFNVSLPDTVARTYYIRVVSRHDINLSLQFLTVAEFIIGTRDKELKYAVLFGVLFIVLIVAVYFLSRRKKVSEPPHLETLSILESENALLEKQLAECNLKLERIATELKQTQIRLVHQEKMASLGELTSNIAHEIQEPLNFVINFAEQIDKSSDLSKILHHAKRADAIVKGMLSHSRINKGEKRFISVNALIEESLQSFKSKNKEPDLRLNREFDHSIPQFECNPQELDSVLANLYANAFYAMQQKMHRAGEEYRPEMTVRTRNMVEWIEIIVHDNGTGIDPLSVKKVFQPFFSTKPGNQGTGLGLALSHGIIVKGLDGELTVRSEENVFTEFTIRLPK